MVGKSGTAIQLSSEFLDELTTQDLALSTLTSVPH
jgi:hypothetical protein